MGKLKVTFTADMELEMSAEDLEQVELLNEEKCMKNMTDVFCNMFEDDEWEKVHVNIQKVKIEK